MTKTSFGQSTCSPILDAQVAQGLVFNMPHEIVWGEPLPICGYLRVGEELRIKYPGFSFMLERKDRSLDRYRGDDSQELGNPTMDKQSPAYGILQKSGELYFNVNGQHPFRDLSPGEYEIEIRYLGEIRTEKKPLTVIARGWRKDVSDALVASICEGTVLADLSDYLSLVRQAALHDADEAGQAEMSRRQEAAWRKGFAKNKREIADKHRSELASLDVVDQSIPLHAYKATRMRCPSKAVEVVSVLDLFAGVRRYLDKPPHAPTAPR